MIMNGDNELNNVELDFFLKGNTSLDTVEAKNPHKWISENSWKDLQKLETLGPSWTGIIESIVKKGKTWMEWYDMEAPEKTPCPDGFGDKLSKF
jgi:dynein heavy chain